MTDTTTTGLAEWLLEQIAEDEAEARDPEWWDARRAMRVLAECEAKRRILNRHSPRIAVEGPYEAQLICGCSDGSDEFLAFAWPCADVRDIASVFADRAGYRPEWRPE